jgi:hypothetical protein
VRIPRPKGPRAKPSPFEPIVTDTEVFHTPRTAANVLGRGVRTVNRLDVPFETFPGGHHFIKESVLRKQMEVAAEKDRRARAARQQNGVSRALSEHPNESACRNAFRRLSKTPELLCAQWRYNRARFTYEVTEELGVCPPGHRLDTVVPGDEYSAQTVFYVPTGGRRSRNLDVLELEERRIEAARQRTVATEGSGYFDACE